MSTAPPFPLTPDQAARLQVYIQTYREYAFSQLPSVERNTTLRALQAIKGKVIELLDQQSQTFPLVLSWEEMTVLKTSMAELLVLSAKQPKTPDRITTLIDLTDLIHSLKTYGASSSQLRPAPNGSRASGPQTQAPVSFSHSKPSVSS